MLRIAVIGAGPWGHNLIRNLAACPGAKLVAVCDRNEDRFPEIHARYPGLDCSPCFETVIGRRDVDAVAIATPAVSHSSLGLAALESGKHVLLEKPMATSVVDGVELVRRARDRRRTLMVDHTFVFSSAVRKMKEIVVSQGLGELYSIDSTRLNLGVFRRDVNVLWDLAPHDLSILDHVLGTPPHRVSALGVCHAGQAQEDMAYLHLDYRGRLLASIHVSWLSRLKVRRISIAGQAKGLDYDDLAPDGKIKVYDREIKPQEDARSGPRGGSQGTVRAPQLDDAEPLQTMVRHFVACISDGSEPVTGGEAGLRVIRVLEAAQRSMKAGGAWATP